jgi:hypothetical protein
MDEKLKRQWLTFRLRMLLALAALVCLAYVLPDPLLRLGPFGTRQHDAGRFTAWYVEIPSRSPFIIAALVFAIWAVVRWWRRRNSPEVQQ